LSPPPHRYQQFTGSKDKSYAKCKPGISNAIYI